jgi:impB/mucB/samB family.
MTGTEYLYPDPVAPAHTIKNRIRDELGFTLNSGIGRNKLCAKMTSDYDPACSSHEIGYETYNIRELPALHE